MDTVVYLTTDAELATRLATAIQGHAGQAQLTSTPANFAAAVDRAFPVLALLDVQSPGDWAAALYWCKMRSQTQAVPIYAFDSLADESVADESVANESSEATPSLALARQNGADGAWSRKHLIAELEALVLRSLYPPIQYLAGWDEPLSAAARAGIVAFNQGDYFDQHEHLEAAWQAETRPIRTFYQGVLQIGLAFLQIERANWVGAVKMFRRGLPRLRSLPPICQGMQLADLRVAAADIHTQIVELGPERLPEFDRRVFPQIKLVEA
jgi:uncharacterized protein